MTYAGVQIKLSLLTCCQMTKEGGESLGKSNNPQLPLFEIEITSTGLKIRKALRRKTFTR